jgi:hypothetical protein
MQLPCFRPNDRPIKGKGEPGLIMTRMGAFTVRGNPLSVVGACILALGVSACSFAGLEPFDDDGAVRQTSRSIGLSPKPVTDTPGFVQASRPQEVGYIPVGVTPPPRVPLKNAQQVESELNALRAANEARAAAPKPASPYDGKVEPGYKPPPPPPIPDGPAVSLPKAPAAAAPPPKRETGPAPQSSASHRKETPEQRKARLERAQRERGGTN